MSKKIKLGICQLAVVEDKLANIKKAEEMVGKAALDGCQLAVLPEMFNCPYQSELFPLFAETWPEGNTMQSLSKLAAREKIILVGGSIPERGSDGRIYNTSFIFDQSGRLLGRHRKVHLFDVDIKGGTVFRESDTLTAGSEITVVGALDITMGIGVCYDIRFVEISRAMVLTGAKVLIFPAAFGPVTGPAHWELLIRSRALDNQAFVVGAAPARTPGAEYQAYGHSMVVDPWGRVLICTGDQETVLTVEIDLDVIDKVREELPILRHRRSDVYQRRLLRNAD